MEVLVAVAVGFNPYAGAFILASLAAFTGRLPLSDVGVLVPGGLWALATVLYGVAMPADFVMSKFVRFAPRMRQVGHIVAPLTAGLAAATVQQSALPTPLVAAGAALLAWVIATTVTANAARMSRSPEWIGLGHIPVLMSTAVAGACIIPLGVALTGLGIGAAALSLLMLGLAELDGRTTAGRPARSTARPAHRALPAAPAPAAAVSAAPFAGLDTPVALTSPSPALRSAGRASGRLYARAYARATAV